jgi:hypothetical protein
MGNIKILWAIYVLLLISCGGGRKAEVDAEAAPEVETDFFVFDLENGIAEGPKFATLNELIDSIRYIPLETHPDALLPARYSFAKIGSDMFVGGGLVPSGAPIYRFDSLGRFVRQMTHVGRGPGEVLLNMEWHANASLRQINVVGTGQNMVVVSTDSGERLPVRYNERQGFHWVPLNDSTFVSARSSYRPNAPKEYLYFIDRAGEVVHSIGRDDELAGYHYTMPEGAWTGPFEGYWLKPDYKGDAILHDIFNDTLYRVKSHREITPHLVFRRGTLSPDPDDIGVNNQENRKKDVYLASVMESGSHVFLNYYHRGEVWCDVWSKSAGTLMIHTIRQRPGRSDEVRVPFVLPDGSSIELDVMGADRDNIYAIMRALDACKFLPGVGEEDNPVVMVVKLKKV